MGHQEDGGKEYVFWCLHSQSWTYYICVVSVLIILEDRNKKEDNFRIKTNKEFLDTKYLKTKSKLFVCSCCCCIISVFKITIYMI